MIYCHSLEEMGKELEGPSITTEDSSDNHSTSKTCAKYVYPRDFLLSLANLEHCRRQPAGIDPVLLRDNSPDSVDGAIPIPASSSRGLIRRERDTDAVSESPPDLPEWRRPSSLSGSSFLHQGPRRTELSTNNASPRVRPSWGDNGSGRTSSERYGGSGLWEQRGRPHLDSDSSARPHGGGFSLAPSHDGLLGSGGPIHQGGLMPSRRPDRHHTPGRTGEPYHVRGGKVSSFSRREDKDSINDETFGSEEVSNEARVEQERQRRESFEQMRKEHQRHKLRDTSSRSFQEFSQKKQDDGWTCDGGQSNEGLLSSSPGTPHSSSSRDEFMKVQNRHAYPAGSLPTTPRPLVPPGFSKVAVQRSVSSKELGQGGKVGGPDATNSTAQPKDAGSDQPTRINAHQENAGIIVEDHNSLSNGKDDDWCSQTMSKFAHWFPSEASNFQSSRPMLDVDSPEEVPKLSSTKSDAETVIKPSSPLLEAFDVATMSNGIIHMESSPLASLQPVKSQGPVIPMPIGPSLEDVERDLTASSYSTISASPFIEHQSGRMKSSSSEATIFSNGDDKEPQSKASPVFLMCEDVEQDLLGNAAPHTKTQEVLNELGEIEVGSESAVDLSVLFRRRPKRESASQPRQGSDLGKDATDSDASRHLMFLLQKAGAPGNNTSIKQEPISPLPEGKSKASDFDQLEALFGKALVTELRSVGEPVSAKDQIPCVEESEVHLRLNDVGKTENFSSQFPRIKVVQNEFKNTQAPDIYNASWQDLSPHGHVFNGGSFDVSNSRHGAFPGNLQLPHVLPHQGHMFPPSLPPAESFFLPAPHMASKGGPFEKYHESHLLRGQNDHLLHSMGMLHPNPPFLQGGSFVQSAELIHAQSGQHMDERSSLARTEHMAPYAASLSEVAGMGFKLNNSMAASQVGGSNFNPLMNQWSSGNTLQASYVAEGFGPYQHSSSVIMPPPPEVHGSRSHPHGTGSIEDRRWAIADARQQPATFTRFDSYSRPNRKLRSG